MVKSRDFSIQELTQREISRVNNDEKLNKIKRDNSRYKRTMLKYKQNEKFLNKKISLLEEKINFLKENSIGSLFSLTETISDIKESFIEFCDGFSNETDKINLKSFLNEFDYISDFIINVCNTIELNSKIQNEKYLEDEEEFDSDIDEIYESDDLDEYEEDDFQWDFKQSSSANIKENQIASEKIHKLFYEAPTDTVKVSSSLQNGNGLFDFNEALNPTMSLNDIMSDLMPVNAQQKNFTNANQLNNDILSDENKDFDAWFLSLQNIISKETK